MSRKGPARQVEPIFAAGRLAKARAFRKAARILATGGDDGDLGDPVIAQVVNATIGYIDALTARYGGRVNQQDHRAAVALLRDVLGNKISGAHLTTLRRILDEKDEAQYGPRFCRISEAQEMLEKLDAFADWAEGLLAG